MITICFARMLCYQDFTCHRWQAHHLVRHGFVWEHPLLLFQKSIEIFKINWFIFLFTIYLPVIFLCAIMFCCFVYMIKWIGIYASSYMDVGFVRPWCRLFLNFFGGCILVRQTLVLSTSKIFVCVSLLSQLGCVYVLWVHTVLATTSQYLSHWQIMHFFCSPNHVSVTIINCYTSGKITCH